MEIYPDEIFLDAKNLPDFDTHQFEGRIEKPIHPAVFSWFGIVALLVFVIFGGRLVKLQVVQGAEFKARSENNRLDNDTIFANRGVIMDRNGVPLAWNDLNANGEFARRAYATSSGFAHLVGYVRYPAKDSSGIYYQTEFTPKDGAELEFDRELSGVNGERIRETDAHGDVVSESVIKPPTPGTNVFLAADARIQAALYERIKNLVSERGFRAGAGVIMDVHTGEIIALTSYPEYDPKTMADGEDVARIQGYLTDRFNPFLDRVVAGQFIPGSIIKPFFALGALEENLIDPEKEILSTGQITIPNPYNPDNVTIFRDWKAHGYVDMRRAIAVSSNVYFFAIGGGYQDQKGLGITRLERYARAFGFGSLTGIDITGEKEGNVPNPIWKKETFGEEEWRLGDTYNTSIGQYGFQVTPIQAVRATAALANGGTLVTPTILKDNPRTLRSVSALPFSADNIRIVQEGLRNSVTEGTASGLNIPGVDVAGKTGTAELGVTKAEVNTWVTGYWPYEHPRYAFAVMMERGPRANTVGATYVMRQLLEWMKEGAPEYLK
jgi:penicillin-binding protein 2